MRTGRPKKTPVDLHDTDMKIPLTKEEKAIIQEAAKIAGAKPVTWARNTLLKSAKRMKRNAESGSDPPE